QLVSAGMYRITPGKFVGYRLLATVGVPLIWLWFATSTGMSAVLTLLGAVFCALMGWWVPTQLVRDRAKRRLAEIDYELPGLIDRPDHARPRGRDAQAAQADGRGEGAEGANQDPLPACVPHLPRDVHRPARAGADPVPPRGPRGRQVSATISLMRADGGIACE